MDNVASLLPDENPVRLLANGQHEALPTTSNVGSPTDLSPFITSTVQHVSNGHSAVDGEDVHWSKSCCNGFPSSSRSASRSGSTPPRFIPAFPKLPGEITLYFSVFEPATQIVLTNFRWFALVPSGRGGFYNVPLQSVESVYVDSSMREYFLLVISCRLSFNNFDACTAWAKIINCTVAAYQTNDMAKCRVFATTFKHHYLRLKEARPDSDLLRLIDIDLEPSLAVKYGVPQIDNTDVDISLSRVKFEFKRLNFNSDHWQISRGNKNFSISNTYPQYLIVPASITDTELEKASKFRSQQRLPVVVWRHPVTGAVLLRSGQPGTWWGTRNDCDEKLILATVEAFRKDLALMAQKAAGINAVTAQTNGHLRSGETSCHRGGSATYSGKGDTGAVNGPVDSICAMLLVMDMRSWAVAMLNRTKGGGVEIKENYRNEIDVQYFGLINIHGVRTAIKSVRTLISPDVANESDKNKWLSQFEVTNWFIYLSQILAAAARGCTELNDRGKSVLVHCSDGWDRTTQFVCLVKMLLDPFYRTMEGFRLLVDMEWVDFGHKFADRCGLRGMDSNECSPVFVQWLDTVHQLIKQFPTSFEFNSVYLIKLAHHCYSSLFGSFLYNSVRERIEAHADEKTFSVWQYLHSKTHIDFFKNGLYSRSSPRILRPKCDVKDMVFWHELYCPSNDPAATIRSPRSASFSRNPPETDLMTTSTTSTIQRAHSESELTSSQELATAGLDGTHIAPEGGSEDDSCSHGLPIPGAMGNRAGSDSNIIHTRSLDQPSSFVQVQMSDELITFSSSSPKSQAFVTPNHARFVVNGASGRHETEMSDDSLPSILTNGHLSSESSDDPPTNHGLSPGPFGFSDTGSDLDMVDGLMGAMEIGLEPNAPAVHLGATKLLKPQQNGHSKTTMNGDIVGASRQRQKSFHRYSVTSSSNDVNDNAFPDFDFASYASSRRRPTFAALKCGPQKLPDSDYWNGHVLDFYDCDGLTKQDDPVQKRIRDVKFEYEKEISIRDHEINQLRFLLNSRRGPTPCEDCQNNSRNVQDSSEPRSYESGADGSEKSWEAVKEEDAEPKKWVPDHAAVKCMNCEASFWVVRRKHHCRKCGNVFCGECSKHVYPVPDEQLYDPVRVCQTCYFKLREQYPQYDGGETENVTENIPA